MPLFSTIVPAYNRESLIAQTLDSILNQTLDDQEIIVVDDGSSDRTVEIVRGYGPRVRLLQQKNQGPGAARNFGVTHATGEYVAFLDSDDVWFPWTLQTYADVIGQNNRPALISGKRVRFSDEAGLARVGSPAPLSVQAYADYLATSDDWKFMGGSWFVVRRDALNAVGGFTPVWVNGEDADLAIRLGTAPGFVRIVAPVTFGYREHAASAMADQSRTVRGVDFLLDAERGGRYPGGAARQYDRWKILTLITRPVILQLAEMRHFCQSWRLFRRTLAWHIRLRRFKFLIGFLVVFISRSLGVRPPLKKVDPGEST